MSSSVNNNHNPSAGGGVGGGGGQQHVATGEIQILNLSTSSQIQYQKYQSVRLELEAKKIAASIDVPALPNQVRATLRGMGLPVRLFGENLANVRDRLRMALAHQQVLFSTATTAADGSFVQSIGKQQQQQQQQQSIEDESDEEEMTKYTRASHILVEARQAIAKYSLERARMRLERERKLRAASVQRKRRLEERNDTVLLELEEMDTKCTQIFNALKQLSLEGSQYGDSRSLSCIATQYVNDTALVATGCWTGTLQLWDGSSPVLKKMGERTMCHEDRIMGIAMQTVDNAGETPTALICTTSIDFTAKLWSARQSNLIRMENDMDSDDDEGGVQWTITEEAQLRGHAARLCRAAFHPMKRHVATTSFDHSWRLWDIETNQECLLLQDGHWKEVYGVGFHLDGSLCATTDFAGVVQLWDLRTGKSIFHFLGHANRVLNAEFHPTAGFQMATAGDDGTVKIWDLRRRKLATSIPAHSSVVTGLKFDPDHGEYLTSCSFDGTIKVWNCRNWKMLNAMQGHEGKVSGVDVVRGGDSKLSLVSCGFDKTLKLWR